MADQTAFNADGTITTTPQDSNEIAQENPTFSELLVGEGRKFQDTEALAKGKYESDQFVDQLQSENKGLREELDRRVTAEDTVDKLLQERSTQQQEGVTTPSPQMSEQDITELVKQTIVTTRTAETEQNNISEADKAMEDRFGDKRAEWLSTKAAELGVGISFLQSIAAASPRLFLTTVGLDKAPEGQGSVQAGSINTEALNVNPISVGAKQGTFKWYEEQRKADPRKFWDPKTQQQLMKDATDKGEAFYA